MDNLAPEILLHIFEGVESLQDLLTLRIVSRGFRSLADRSCGRLAFSLAQAHFHAFNDALVAVRLKRIPFEACCHYNLLENAYSFYPSKEFLQAVLDGKPVLSECPTISPMPWIEEMKAVVDVYLLALAWTSTISCFSNIKSNSQNDAHSFIAGIDLPQDLQELATPFLEAYVRSFYRLCIFYTIFGPRVFVAPVLDAVQKLGSGEGQEWEREEEVCREIYRFPLYLPIERRSTDGSEHTIFQGFFEWLYAQPEPDDKIRRVKRHRETYSSYKTFTDQEREQVALMQLWKVSDAMFERKIDNKPSPDDHIEPLFNPTYFGGLLPAIIYRPKLRISPWSEPQAIVDHWARSEDVCSIVQVCQDDANVDFVVGSVIYDRLNNLPFELMLETELKNRFGLRYVADGPDMSLEDRGLLDPRIELCNAL
jgi:hypothetical protein